MKPVTFAGQNQVIARNQPPYLPLPAHLSSDLNVVTTCWQPTWRERFRMLRTGAVWLQQLSFGRPIHPVKVLARKPVLE